MKKNLLSALLCLLIFSACNNSPASETNDPTPLNTISPKAQTALHLVAYENKESGLWGYKDQDGRPVLKATFSMANDFNEHLLASVIGDTGWMLINQRGETVLHPFVFDNGPDSYSTEGLARFVENDLFGFFNQKGEKVIPAAFDFANAFEDGYATVCKGCEKTMDGEHFTYTGGKWGLIDAKGVQKVALEHESAEKAKATIKKQ